LGGFFNEDESFRAYKAVNDKNNENKKEEWVTESL
jgi:hypothetical protein